MLLMSLWILRPFLLSVVWAGLVVIATWPVMLRFQGWMGGRRAPAVLSMVLLLIAFFVLPLLFMTGSLLDVSAKASAWFSTGQLQAILTPEMIHKIPVIGPRLYLRWQGIIADHGQGLLTHLQPWVRGAAITLIGQLGHLGQRLVSGFLMLAFSALFYVSGETVAKGISLFAHRLAGERGAMAVTLTGQTVKAVASGIVVTAVCQSVLGGIGLAVCGVPDAMLLTIVIFVLCLAQLGPLVVMLPATVWMYWQGMAGWASVLIVWSLAVGSMDNILRPMLIRRGADLPMTIILSGVIGGLLAFGMIGLFIGPAVLAVSWRLLVAWVSESGSPAVNVQ
jgi:predicted PurR-regulated permease PerM